MCQHFDDTARTIAMVDDLATYAERPEADQEFANTVGFALTASLYLAAVTDRYPPAGHGYPAAESE